MEHCSGSHSNPAAAAAALVVGGGSTYLAVAVADTTADAVNSCRPADAIDTGAGSGRRGGWEAGRWAVGQLGCFGSDGVGGVAVGAVVVVVVVLVLVRRSIGGCGCDGRKRAGGQGWRRWP